MTTPPKAKKSPRNQPIVFDETLDLAASNLSLLGPHKRLNARQVRGLLIVIWAAASVFGGIGLGLLLRGDQNLVADQPPLPVATAAVTVRPMEPSGSIALAQPNLYNNLPVVTPRAITQAQAGQPFAVVSLSTLQPGSATLQPGFTPYGRAQGNRGTAPVR